MDIDQQSDLGRHCLLQRHSKRIIQMTFSRQHLVVISSGRVNMEISSPPDCYSFHI